ncbi:MULTISPECIES: sirohydrochlorin chelatase [Marinobacter]|jgi:sirohydrochlorin cobaltochelatase|uniref:sirohydrochlorin chelatase n=1 Tax=Marinobacter TaxID=2742 RepID=UPI0007D9EF5B|nr:MULTISPECIES: CbiX/SirB N-terminal domain-containing protein [Marinobacter]MBL3824197.1 CbiX/SirB N-terminal domain-containing protein [Marinobacter sp. MC3]MBL3892711.1 CbiX/SirB N-terminal domain-containing protein [Marinobacter sp. MW3]MCD1647474.1 CbiX/SirB N-terminal domain-containing protein [Marinobacter adhaerens]OAN92587.1 cobalamin biosynthesis protein CbiX [Marinobacter sp. EhN04]OAN95094.1 cobalamin biosynthesis protein CbiX [Marinobacter sp. EhC06]
MNSPRIILLAHGSSDKRWCETFEQLAAPTLASIDNARVAYMELAEPSMDTVIKEGVSEGATEFTIIPLFLAAGRHLRKDVPAMIEELEKAHGATIQLAPPIGENPLLGQAIRDVVMLQLEQTPA